MWYFAIYSVVSRSALEIALRPKNMFFLILVNIGAFLIYYVIARLISEQNKTLELKEKNHRLTMQAVQYENLQEKITDARRAKHDVRHHIALIQEYLNRGELDALRRYLDRYSASLPDDSLVRFCENAAANAVLLYFAQQAKDNDTDYIVKADIPGDIFVSDTDISVLFGNLLENALDACRKKRTTTGGSSSVPVLPAVRSASRWTTPLPERSNAPAAESLFRSSTRGADSAHSRSEALPRITAASAALKSRTTCSAPQ